MLVNECNLPKTKNDINLGHIMENECEVTDVEKDFTFMYLLLVNMCDVKKNVTPSATNFILIISLLFGRLQGG